MSTDTPKTFISFSREDAEYVLNLATNLRSAGANIWIDQLDIPTGERWDRVVQKAWEDCEYFMVVLSPSAVDSENVMDEVAFALGKKK